ncbi:MAG: hypothetical protein WCD69_12530, partial [Xanthobacteraceae bacterium]
NLFCACMVAAAGLVIAAQTIGTAWVVVGMSIAAIGFYGSKGSFWAMPPMILTGTAAASGIAWINSVGNLGGFFGPTAVGWAKDYTGGFSGGRLCTHVGDRIRAGAAHSKSRGATRDCGSAGRIKRFGRGNIPSSNTSLVTS